MSKSSVWEQQWPELFARLEAGDRKAMVSVLANSYLEGLEPDREFVANFVDYAAGTITEDEYDRRAAVWASRRRAASRAS